MPNIAKDHPSLVTGIVASVAIGVFVLLTRGNVPSVAFGTFGLETISSVLAPLAVVAVLIERATEVFFGIAREPGEGALKTKRDSAAIAQQLAAKGRTAEALSLAAVAEGIGPKPSVGLATARMVNGLGLSAPPWSTKSSPAWTAEDKAELKRLVDKASESNVAEFANVQRTEAELQLLEFTAQDKRLFHVASLALGVLCALSGIRVLSRLVDTGTSVSTLFTITDVLLTAGLLGGGAGAFHALTSVFREVLDSKKVQARPAAKASPS